VTEIPEHLLKRSQARRGDAAASTDGAATPATTAAAAPAVAAPKAPAVPAGPPPAKPDLPVVAAYKARKKIPVWAMLTLSILPVWAFLYVLALRPEAVKAVGPLGAGAKLYSGCAGCHGSAGEGGVGYAFANGSVLKTFPHIEDQLRWVSLGSEAYKSAGVQIAGDPNREGGAHIAGAKGVMPNQAPTLSDAQILAVVCEERYGIAGGDEASAEFTTWCAPDSAIYAALEAGTATFADLHTKFDGVLEIGTVPLAGTTAG
jgi:mono/diheme cytochrome c family protein